MANLSQRRTNGTPFSTRWALLLPIAALLLSSAAAYRVLPGCSTGNQTRAFKDRRLLQENVWSQPSSGPVNVNRVYGVLAKYVTTANAGILLRMAFHDGGTYDKGARTGGANGSLKYELGRALNGPIAAQWSVIESIKGQLPNVSYADVIFLAGVYAMHVTGGPLVTSVRTGRVDATGPDPDNRLPLQTWDVAQLTAHFGDAYGFGVEELVALSGAHSIGKSEVTPPLGPMDDTWTVFDVRYYQRLVNGGGSFKSDQVLSQDSQTSPYVRKYAGDQDAWWDAFVDAMKELGDLGATYKS